LDTLLNYGCRSCRWDVVTERVRSIFDRHDFAFCWSYAEMAPLVTGHGYDWANEKTAKCIEELVALVRPEEAAAAKVAAKATKRSAKGAELFFVDEDAVPPAAYVPPPVIRA